MVAIARVISDPIDLIATGYECLTESCSAESVALAFVPILPGPLGRAADDMADVTKIGRKAENIGSKLPNSGWANLDTLADHFERHGADFGANTADEYAAMARDFFDNSQRSGVLTKIDQDGVIRIWDPNTNFFGSYNPDGTTRTFYKPKSPSYWNRQPGSAPWFPEDLP